MSQRAEAAKAVLERPKWIRGKAVVHFGSGSTDFILKEHGVNTICQEGACPNIGECWKQKHAAFMILGDICTRACRFCNVMTGKPGAVDPFEPEKIANAVKDLGLEHVVITSVDRDDLPDGGAEHFAKCIRAIRNCLPKTTIEVLTPDFLKKGDAPGLTFK